MSDPADPRDARLLRDGGFLRLWGGETASQVGAQLGRLAIPVLAVEVLAATEFQVGLLTAAETAAFLLIGLPAGAWIDRMRKRRVMLAADLVRAVALAAVPILWLAGALAIWHVLVIAAVVGAATVFFDVGYQSYIPVLVRREHIAEANAKLETTAQGARIAGPAAAGGLLAILAAPLLLAATACTYLLSFLVLTTIRDDERPAPRADRRPLRVEIVDGLAWVWRQPLLRRIVLCTGVGNLFTTIAMTMLPLLALRDVGLSPAALGLAGSAGAIGGLVAAAFAARIARRFGEGAIIPISAVALGVAVLALPLIAAAPAAAVPILIAVELVLSAAVIVYNVMQVSFRQRICPPRLLGRMNASIRFLVWGVMPIGGLVAGVASTLVGIVPTMIAGGVGTLVASGFVVFSPLRTMRTLPDVAAEAPAAP
jgi:predicted MFS family arabinose efflux permease